ncbi:TOBE domain-containing protein, partial [Yinghuangia seranimata]|uniref:TOBE domain-containing protein n=1 Tax=Yinghuangia seranimata TaxID=408067 RepID=UPI00248BF60D
TMADTIAVMNGGVIEQLGSPAELYESPRTAFVANFLGQSNLLPAKVVGRSGDDLLLDVHGTRMALPAARSTAAGDSLVMGVRPEKITLARASAEGLPDDGRNRLRAVVTEASFIGVSTEYRVRIDEGAELVVFSQNRDDERPVPGDEVVLHWSARHGFGLDPAQDLDAGTGEGAL